MGDDTIEIRDDNINVEEIMATIRENIRRRKAAGELPPDPDSVIISSTKNFDEGESDNTFQHDLSFIHTNWDIHNNRYVISTHHPYIGKFLVKGRQIVNGEVRRYVDPIISWQTEFNARTVRLISSISERCDALNQHQQEMETVLDSKIELATREQTKNLEFLRHELNAEIEARVQERQRIAEKLLNQMDTDIQAHAWIAHVLEERIQKDLVQISDPPAAILKEDTNYFLFEERFRGSRDTIAQRQQVFLPYFEKCSRVLDIGCGRGEFLEILKNHAIGGIGVDSDPDMVAYCRSRQLVVEHADAITYLETFEDKSLDGIFIDQVVEHLEPDYLIRLLALCHKKLKFGYFIVVETVNPLSFVSFVNFYIDMTHKRPVHPETLQYLFSASGFRECEKKFFSPVSDDSRLKKIEAVPDLTENEKKNVDVYNHNVEMLNTVLFGAQDYAVVGKK
jgi:O-antigen chain-terminating methyltransferase